MKRGADFEAEVRRGLKLLPGWWARWPNCAYSEESPADFVGLAPNGRFVAIECKSTRAKSFPLSNLKTHQRASLRRIDENGGCSFVALRYKTGRGKYRCFVINYSDFEKCFLNGAKIKSIPIKALDGPFFEAEQKKDEKGYKYWELSRILELAE